MGPLPGLPSILRTLALAFAMQSVPAGGKAPVAAGDAKLDENGFVATFAELQKLGDAGKWSEEKAALLELLAKAGDQPWIQGRRAEIVDEFKRASIRTAVPQPDPSTMTDGKLLSWDRRTGEFSIDYVEGCFNDFARAGAFYLHPALLDGPFTLKISGSDFRWAGEALLHFILATSVEEMFEVMIGARKDI